MDINTSALIGLGAVGTVYGHLLHERYGSDFAVIAGGARGNTLMKTGAKLNGCVFFPRVLTPEAGGTAPDLILVAVKNHQLDAAMEDMARFVGEKTVILTLLNGITARDRLAERFPRNRVLYGLTIFIDSIRTPEGVLNTVNGLVRFGDADNSVVSPVVRGVQNYLNAAGIETEVCPDMIQTIWKKWMLNLGCNQVSAATGARYGALMHVAHNRVLFHDAMMEAVALAEASGIDITEADVRAFEETMRTFSPESKTSMLQDVEAKRKTEVDEFGGTAIKIGKRLGIPTPVNYVLYHVIRAQEETW